MSAMHTISLEKYYQQLIAICYKEIFYLLNFIETVLCETGTWNGLIEEVKANEPNEKGKVVLFWKAKILDKNILEIHWVKWFR